MIFVMNTQDLNSPLSTDRTAAHQPSSVHASQPNVPFVDPSHQSKDYFFRDGSLTLQAESVVYRVHIYLFERHSKSFIKNILTPSLDGQPAFLEGVSSHDLDQLLSVLYPLDFQSFTPKTVAQWSSVLALSTKWEFTSMRQLAIDQLTLVAQSADKVSLGRAYGVNQWLFNAYTDLCKRFEPLSLEEGEKLDKADIIRIMRVRHDIGHKKVIVDCLVRQTFSLEPDPSEVVSSTAILEHPPELKEPLLKEQMLAPSTPWSRKNTVCVLPPGKPQTKAASVEQSAPNELDWRFNSGKSFALKQPAAVVQIKSSPEQDEAVSEPGDLAPSCPVFGVESDQPKKKKSYRNREGMF